jgi:DHA1 family inner membrane transport protein
VTVVGPQHVFVLYGLIGLLAIPLALRLPPLRAAAESKVDAAGHRWIPTPLNILFFVIAFGADGVFAATLSTLLADLVPVSQALVAAGLLLAGQRLVSIVLALASGPIIDRFDAGRLLVPASVVVALGLAGIALGHVYTAAVVLIVARALIAVIGPIVAAQRSPADRITAMAAYTTWSDSGLALGPLLGTLAVLWFGFAPTYVLLAVLTLAALAWEAWAARGLPPR